MVEHHRHADRGGPAVGSRRVVWSARLAAPETPGQDRRGGRAVDHLLLTHPPLLLLTPLLLGVFALTSIPFLTLLIRLGMIGYWRHPRENTYIFHIRPYAGWLIFLVTLVWVWTWGVIRGVGRVAVAGVVGEWYFHR
jgi:hypothetical protein